MTQELFYTSALRGLKPGSRGFCTVMSTSGMAKNLADRLEALSGYRHVFAPNDPSAHLNPIAFSHLRITVGGKPFHVLSRICAAGLDYTQRSNKFAHHVVLDQKELVPAGPGALLCATGFMETTWEGEPRICGNGRRPPSFAAAPAACRHWQQVAGDAGWAGVLAETATVPKSRVTAVIFPPGTDTISLVAEALALLPPPLRWQVTFSTYFTKLPPEVECQWRFVLAGSPEAKAAERSPNLLAINLGNALGRAPDGPWVEGARTGKPPQLSAAAIARPAVQAPIAPIETPVGLTSDGVASSQPYDHWDFPPHSGELGGVIPKVPRLQSTRLPRQRALALSIAGTLTAIVVAATGMYLVFSQVQRQNAANNTVAATKVKESYSAKTNAVPKVDVPAPIVTPAGATTEQGDAEKQGPETLETTDSNDKSRNAVDPRGGTDKAPEAADNRQGNTPANHSQHKNAAPPMALHTKSLLELPKYFDVQSVKPKSSLQSDVRSIAEIAGIKSAECTFELLGRSHVLKDGWILFLEEQQTSKKPSQLLIRVKKPARENAEGAPTTVAVVTLVDSKIEFSWERITNGDTQTRAHELANCVLQVSFGNATRAIALRAPASDLPPIQISFDAVTNEVPLTSVLTWPKAPLYIDVPEDFKQRTAAIGYSIDGVGTDRIQIATREEDMPLFTMTIDSQRRCIKLTYEWTLLGPPDGKEKRLLTRVKQLTNEQKRFAEQLETLNKKKERFQNENKSKAEMDGVQGNINSATDDWKAATKKLEIITKVKDQWKLEGKQIPFIVGMHVESLPVVVAETQPSDK